MLFSNFASYLSELEKTASRNKMTEILAGLFKKTSPEEIDKVCYLSLGSLAPKYAGLEFNMAEKMVVRALAMALEKPIEVIIKEYKKLGDLGELVFKIKTSPRKSNASVAQIYKDLRKIAEESGEGSVERKIKGLAGLVKNLDPLSAKFLARIPVNKLRLGFSDMTILDSLSWSKTGDKTLRPELERAFNVLADIGKVAQIFKAKGIKGLKVIKSEVGVPIRAAKAERLPAAQKILEKMRGKCALEEKFDGMRMQLHLDKTRKFELQEETNLALFKKKKYFVRIFSRNLENMTYMFPDVVEAAQKLAVKKVILDGEAIAYNTKTGKFLPFQETVQRKRKHGVGKKAQEMPLKLFVFDILYHNGQTLLTKPFAERRKLLEGVLEKSRGEEKRILLTPQKVVTKVADFEAFFKEMVGKGLEGLVAKKLDTVYQAGARNYNWVKYKAGMKSELADTIDCVVLGFYRGRGKRAGFGIGAFLVGVIKISKIKYKKSNIHIKNQKEQKLKIEDFEGYVTVSKIGTGLTDEQWREMYRKCQMPNVKCQKKPKEYMVDKNLYPDVWCQPRLVVEIEADTITKSPIHTAGLALRFPRLKRFRDDKDPDQATSLQELKKLAKVKK